MDIRVLKVQNAWCVAKELSQILQNSSLVTWCEIGLRWMPQNLTNEKSALILCRHMAQLGTSNTSNFYFCISMDQLYIVDQTNQMGDIWLSHVDVHSIQMMGFSSIKNWNWVTLQLDTLLNFLWEHNISHAATCCILNYWYCALLKHRNNCFTPVT